MLSVDDGLMRLRMRLNEIYGQSAVHLHINIGTEYSWGWSLYYQDHRPDHFLVGQGAVLFNRETGQLFEAGSASTERESVISYEYLIGVRDDWRVVLTSFPRSQAHLQMALKAAGLLYRAQTFAFPMEIHRGGKGECDAIVQVLAGEGVTVSVLPADGN